MPRPVPEAVKWAAANPEDPRAKRISALDWAYSNPEDPRSGKLFQKYGGPSDPGMREVPKSRPQQLLEQTLRDNEKYAKDAPAAMALGAGGAFKGPITALGRIFTNAVGGGVQGAMQPAESGSERAMNAFKQGGLAAGASVLGEGAGKALGKSADYLMQKAVGMRKYFPGVGSSLLQERQVGNALTGGMPIAGTRNMMEEQVGRQLPLAENKVQEAANRITSPGQNKAIFDRVSRVGGKFINPDTGEALPGMEKYLEQVRRAAEKHQGESSGQALLKTKRAGDWVSRGKGGDLGSTLEAEIGAAQADAARGELERLSGGEMPKALFREKALVNAQQALEKPESIPQGAASWLFNKIPGQGLFGSVGAHALQSGANASTGLVNPATLQQLFLRNSTPKREE